MTPALKNAMQTAQAIQAAEPKLNQLKKATQQFESIFVKKMLETMRRGVEEVSLGDQTGKQVYRDLTDTTLADRLASSGSFGVGKILFRDFAPKVIALEQQRLQAEASAAASRPVQKPANQPSQPLSEGHRR